MRLALAAAVVGSAVAVGLAWPNTSELGKQLAAEGTRGTAPPGEGVVRERRQVPLPTAERDSALAAARAFVQSAVQRTDAGRSWRLAHAELRHGYTEEQWRGGDIPVVPYPVREALWRVGYSYSDEVGLEVYVEPKAGERLRPMVFDMQLKAVGEGDARRWLVSAWAPRGGSLWAEPPPPDDPVAAAAASEEIQSRWRESRLAGRWALVPLALLLGGLGLPLWLVLRERVLDRRAEARFARHRAERAAARRDGVA